MKKTSIYLYFFLTLVEILEPQELLSGIRRQLYENGTTPELRFELWKQLRGRLYPLTDDILEARLESNMNFLGAAMVLLIDRPIIWKETLYYIEIAELAEKHHQFTKNYLKKHNNTPASFRLAYARLMMLITPILNRTDRSNVLFNPVGYFTQYDDFERLKDIAFELVKENPENPDHWMLLSEYRILLSNYTGMTHTTLADRHLRKAIEMYEKMERKEDLAWAYLWQSALYMRRSLNECAYQAIEKSRKIFPNSFLVEEARKRFEDELPWM